MQGVEILHSTVVYNTIIPEYWVAIGFFGMMICLFLAVFFIVQEKFIPLVLCGVLAVGAVGLMVCGDETTRKAGIRYVEHEVIIDDSVSMTEFFAFYEIIDQRGQIYIVRERSSRS